MDVAAPRFFRQHGELSPASSTGNACKEGTEEKYNWGHGNQQVATEVEQGHGFMVY